MLATSNNENSKLHPVPTDFFSYCTASYPEIVFSEIAVIINFQGISG